MCPAIVNRATKGDMERKREEKRRKWRVLSKESQYARKYAMWAERKRAQRREGNDIYYAQGNEKERAPPPFRTIVNGEKVADVSEGERAKADQMPREKG